MKKLAALVAIALSAALALGGCSGSGETASVQSVAMICGIGSTANVERFAGVVETKTETKIEKDEAFSVSEILVSVGDVVEEGQILFVYDKEKTTLELEKAELELQLSKSTVEEKKANITQLEKERASAPAASKLGYTLQIQQLEVEITEAEYSIAAKEKELESQRAQLEDLEVKAPVSGAVQSINTSGQTDSNGNPLPFMVITEMGNYRVKGYVNEANRASLYEGMSVLIRSRVDGTVQKGTLQTIDVSNPTSSGNSSMYYGVSSDDTTTSSKYPFYVELTVSDGFILGQHVYIEPDYGQADNAEGVIMLPQYYILDADTNPWVWAESKSGKLEKRSLTLGTYDELQGAYEVTAGLAAEDYIAYPSDDLKAGMACSEYDGYIPIDDNTTYDDDDFTYDDDDMFIGGDDSIPDFIEGETEGGNGEIVLLGGEELVTEETIEESSTADSSASVMTLEAR